VALTLGTDSPGTAVPLLEETHELTVEHMERLVDRALAAFTHAKLLKGWGTERSRQRLREALYRWKLTKVDTAILHGLFAWVLNVQESD
jgi:tRNA C32,U32 (ribose-2'-O)-methylase TrmJ